MLATRNFLQGLLLPLGITSLFWLFLFTFGRSLLGEMFASPNAGVGSWFYYLIKGSILWVPLGLVFSLAGRADTLQRWLLSGIVTFIVAAALTGAAQGFWDYMEAVFALVGTWLGLWIGGQTHWERSSPEPAITGVAGSSFADRPRLSSLRLPSALMVLGLTGLVVWSFPRWQAPLGAGLLIYFIILLRYRNAWLFVLPALLPTLNLAPWTGRLSLDEFDLIMLVTFAGALYHDVHPKSRPLAPRPISLLLSGYGLVCMAAFLIGLFPMPDLDINSFDNYFSRFNSWTVGKGFLWGFLFLGLVRWTLPGGDRTMERLFVPGLLSGLIVVALVGLHERWQFADIIDFSVPYRITATFSSMHTGGAHLDAYLALLVPFIGYWMLRTGRAWAWLAGGGLFFLAVYLVISTVTRTTIVVLIIQMALLVVFWLKALSRSRRKLPQGVLTGVLIAVVAAPLLYLGMGGSFFQHRLDTVERDSEIRLNHWAGAAGMMERGFMAQALGMGFGRFPAAFLEKSGSGVVPGRYRFEQTGSNTFLRLLPGETLYLAQKVPVSDHKRYTLVLDVRSEAESASVSAPLCEKHLLNSKRCRWLSHRFTGGDDHWQRWSAEFDSNQIGEGNWLSRRPVELSLYNPNRGAVVDIDNVSLQDAVGNELLNNGTFESGGDYWFFKTHEHLPWHIKNLWVSALFEQGWLGVFLLSFLLIGLAIYLFGPAWYAGHTLAAVVFVAISGFAATGLFASPFDAPRITLLFFTVIAFGLYGTSAEAEFRSS